MHGNYPLTVEKKTTCKGRRLEAEDFRASAATPTVGELINRVVRKILAGRPVGDTDAGVDLDCCRTPHRRNALRNSRGLRKFHIAPSEHLETESPDDAGGSHERITRRDFW